MAATCSLIRLLKLKGNLMSNEEHLLHTGSQSGKASKREIREKIPFIDKKIEDINPKLAKRLKQLDEHISKVRKKRFSR